MWREILPELRAIRTQLHEHERRAAASEMRGKIPKGGVDPKKGLCRIVLGKNEDGEDVLSPWVPYKQTAGALKFHNPPSEGQVMALRSEGGDVQQALAEPFRWNDDNPDPSEDGDQHVLKFGDVTLTLTSGGIELNAGGATFVFSGAGFKQTGGSQEHDGKNVGADHVHGGVTPGGANTAVPSN